ncbi:F-box protein CPR1-like [Impatiens glandulifera]|uniref:F-box protein CPR1-like n=1 Tax=Impatiens glandulifera TaxID=253017 RepID=UPI001FB112C2|nr:F-box protein CPR1-like [Impatiens glandulifera]
MSLIPNEILTNIFSRLPVKSLLRLKCLSKFWLAQISSPSFIKMHLTSPVQTKNLLLFLENQDIFQVDFDSLEDGSVVQLAEVDYIPLICSHAEVEFCGSCDGLICMANAKNADYVVLWNPSTRECFNLDSTCIDNPDDAVSEECIYRLGYDKINDDYKVVRLAFYLKELFGKPDYEVKVYSMKTDSWHTSEKFPYYPSTESIGNSVAGGAMHWISDMKLDSQNKRMIVAFDFRTEKYRVISPPESQDPYDCLFLDNLEGCLSISCSRYLSLTMDLFLLKEYGGENEHWSKLITWSPTFSFQVQSTMVPIAYSKCGKKVLLNLDDERLGWYNLEEKTFEEIRIHGIEEFIEADICVESLVCIDV